MHVKERGELSELIHTSCYTNDDQVYRNGHRYFNRGGCSNWRSLSTKAHAILSKRRPRVSWTLHERHSIGVLFYGLEARNILEVQVVYLKGMDARFCVALILIERNTNIYLSIQTNQWVESLLARIVGQLPPWRAKQGVDDASIFSRTCRSFDARPVHS